MEDKNLKRKTKNFLAAVFAGFALCVLSFGFFCYAETQEKKDDVRDKQRPRIKYEYITTDLDIGVTIMYGVHDNNRPRPPVVTPAEQPGQPPSDAIVLFDGRDTSQWEKDRPGGGDIEWKVENGYMEIAKKAGGIRTKKSFGNCQLHIEWAAPAEVNPKATGQSRGNSGVFFMGRYELQILDSYQNETYADGQAASIYGQHPPLVNACRGPGQWQSYDVSFLRPVFAPDQVGGKGNCIRKARITVLHNGAIVHNNVEIEGATAHKQKAKYSPHDEKAPISLQDHGNPIRFRNIWIRELPEQPYLIKE